MLYLRCIGRHVLGQRQPSWPCLSLPTIGVGMSVLQISILMSEKGATTNLHYDM